MKILMLLTNPFRPDPGPYKEALSLIENGNNVEIIAWDREKKYPKSEEISGIRINRVKVKGDENNFLLHLCKLPIFYFNAFFKGLKSKCEIVHCHDLDTLPLGVIISKIKNCKIIYDAHEDYVGMVEQSIPDFFSKLLEKIEIKYMKKTDSIITVNEAVVKVLKNRSDKDIEIVMNCPPLKNIPSNIKIKKENSKFVLLYIGTIGPRRFLKETIDIVSKNKDFELRIGGNGSYKDIILKMSEKHKNIIFLGWVKADDIIKKSMEADALFVLDSPKTRNARVGLPNKVFEAMAIGKPIIVCKDTYAGKFVEKNKCGIAIPYDEEAFVKAVMELKNNKELRSEFGKNGRKQAAEKYNWEKQEEKLIKIYEKLKK